MTPETQATLTALAEQYEGHAESSPPTSGARERLLSVAAALSDVLTPRVCGRCRHADTESARPGWCYCAAPMRPAQVGIDEHDRRYPFHHKAVPLDEGCKGWQAREGEGGGR